MLPCLVPAATMDPAKPGVYHINLFHTLSCVPKPWSKVEEIITVLKATAILRMMMWIA